MRVASQTFERMRAYGDIILSMTVLSYAYTEEVRANIHTYDVREGNRVVLQQEGGGVGHLLHIKRLKRERIHLRKQYTYAQACIFFKKANGTPHLMAGVLNYTAFQIRVCVHARKGLALPLFAHANTKAKNK